jgi:hypothetical protein
MLHERWRRRTSLLAAGALSGAEEARAREHAHSCEACSQELLALEGTLRALAADPARRAEPPLPLEFMRARVLARLAEAEPRRSASILLLRPIGWSLAAAAAVALAVVAVRVEKPSLPPAASGTPVAESISVSEEALSLLERNLQRAQTARYLSEAQDVLVTVASAPARCDRETQKLDVADESRRSRELLRKRALLIDLLGEDVASARPVLEDVETLLREVAALEACARRKDIEAIQGEMSRRRLLMKIDLMTRELLG